MRVRVRRKIRQNAHVRAKCVRGNISKCEVRACEVKYIAPNILINTLHNLYRYEQRRIEVPQAGVFHFFETDESPL